MTEKCGSLGQEAWEGKSLRSGAVRESSLEAAGLDLS